MIEFTIKSVKQFLLTLLTLTILLFSNTTTADKTNYLKVFVDNKQIKYNAIVYISTFPEFPSMSAEVPFKSNNVIWKLKALFNRPNRNESEKPHTIKHHGSNIWNFSKELDTDFIGGLLTLSAKTNNGKIYVFSLNIRAKNPLEKEILKYIGEKPKFAQAIAIHESGIQAGRKLCQFNEIGELGNNYLTSIKHTPNRGNDTLGWGIFQITNPAPSKTDLWNWKANIDKGKKILQDKEKMAKEYFNAVKRTYPDKYEPPPKSIKVSNTILTPIEAATIQLYNGAAVVKSLKNSYGSFSTYASCWLFLPENPSGKKWVFKQNRNHYVEKVVLAYEKLQKK